MKSTKKGWILLPAGLTIVLALAACSGPSEAPPSDTGVSAGCPDPDGELAEAAREEGEVVMTGTPDGAVRDNLPAAFEETYGVTLTYIGGRNSEIAAKLAAERQAGQYTHDVFGGGGNTMSNTYYGEGWIQDLKAVLDPALLDPAGWRLDGPKFIDPEESYILQNASYIDSGVLINTDLVGADDIQTFEDLLDPKYKGKIAMFEPRQSGGAIFDVGSWAEAYGDDFIRQLYVDQEPVLLTDHRQIVDGVARGTYLIGVSVQASETAQAISQGLPVAEIKPTGADRVLASGSSLLALNDQPAHPEAAKLLVNWLACADGAAVWMNSLTVPSMRSDVDVPAEIESKLPTEGESYFDSNDWEFLTDGANRLTDLLVEYLGPL